MDKKEAFKQFDFFMWRHSSLSLTWHNEKAHWYETFNFGLLMLEPNLAEAPAGEVNKHLVVAEWWTKLSNWELNEHSKNS